MLALGVSLLGAACAPVHVGFEPDEGESGSGGGGRSGGGGGYDTAGTTGARPAGNGGTSNNTPPSACDFGSTKLPKDPRPLLTSAEVLSRIYLFLENDADLPQGEVPDEPTSRWAASEAEALLDAHAEAATAAPGLTRLLEKWLALPEPAEPTAPSRWAQRLVEPDATLSTLLAGETDEAERVGILSESEFLSGYPTISGRGWWMTRSFTCIPMPPPPPGLDHLPLEPVEFQTRRQTLENATIEPICTSCHRSIDPFGFSLEHFDEHGDYREQDGEQAVDASGTLYPSSMSFGDYRDLAAQLATSCEAARCFAEQVIHDAWGQELYSEPFALTPEEVNRVATDFVDSDFSIRVLIDSIVRSPSFLR